VTTATDSLPTRGELTLGEYFLGLLSDLDVDWLVAAGQRQTLPTDDVLVRVHAEPPGLYFVLSGSFVVSDASGEIVAHVTRGELIGEVSFIDGRPATATVAAEEASIVFGIERQALARKLGRDVGFGGRFYRAVAAVLATRFRGRMEPGGGHHATSSEHHPASKANPHLAATRFERLLARMAHAPGAVVLTGNDLTVFDVARVATERTPVEVTSLALDRMARSRAVVERALDSSNAVYGLTTGLGSLKDIRVARDEMQAFQRNIVMSHATGIGPEFSSTEVRAIMLARLNGMCRGGSGVHPDVFQLLLHMLNAGIHPVVPSRGSIGMSDLAPLAHLALPMIGLGEVEHQGRRMPALDALKHAGLSPAQLGPKDALALCSANSASVGHGALVLHKTLQLLASADLAAALSLEAFQAHVSPLDERTHAVRPYTGELVSAERLRRLLEGSTFWQRARVDSVQDPLSLRCVPQVHGACQDALAFVRGTMEIELNGTGDNPVVLIDEGSILSNGNFHSAGLAIAFDTLGIVLGQLSGLATSRVLRVLDPNLTDLPPALVPRAGVNTGFNVLQKTLTALNAENRFLAAPASLDFQPVAGEIEDHATNAALCVRKAAQIVDNCLLVQAIEILVATQAISLRGALTLGRGTRAAFEVVREVAPFVDEDRVLAPVLDGVAGLLTTGRLLQEVRRRAGIDLQSVV
jgi:histidine ammonia-lyase